jgi:hypothetical protein
MVLGEEMKLDIWTFVFRDGNFLGLIMFLFMPIKYFGH